MCAPLPNPSHPKPDCLQSMACTTENILSLTLHAHAHKACVRLRNSKGQARVIHAQVPPVGKQRRRKQLHRCCGSARRRERRAAAAASSYPAGLGPCSECAQHMVQIRKERTRNKQQGNKRPPQETRHECMHKAETATRALRMSTERSVPRRRRRVCRYKMQTRLHAWEGPEKSPHAPTGGALHSTGLLPRMLTGPAANWPGGGGAAAAAA